MSDRIRGNALLRIGEDALLDVGCCLDRFDVDSFQCLSWKLHAYLANKSHILPVRLLDRAEISGYGSSVSTRDFRRVERFIFGEAQREVFELGLAAIKDSYVKYIELFEMSGRPTTEEEIAQITAVAATVEVRELRLRGRLTHMSPPALHRLIFGFKSIKQLILDRFNGSQLTEDFLRECAYRQIWRIHVVPEVADAGPLAFGDEALLDYLYADDRREVILSAFGASPQFVQKLISRAHLAVGVFRTFLQVEHLPKRSQQLGGMRLVKDGGYSEHSEQLANGLFLTLEFGPQGFKALVSAHSEAI